MIVMAYCMLLCKTFLTGMGICMDFAKYKDRQLTIQIYLVYNICRARNSRYSLDIFRPI